MPKKGVQFQLDSELARDIKIIAAKESMTQRRRVTNSEVVSGVMKDYAIWYFQERKEASEF